MTILQRLLLFASVSLLTCCASATTPAATITIEGTVSSGKDIFGVFGPKGADLKVESFTLVHNLAEIEKQQYQDCSVYIIASEWCLSGITQTTGTVSLSIGKGKPVVEQIIADAQRDTLLSSFAVIIITTNSSIYTYPSNWREHVARACFFFSHFRLALGLF